MTENVRERLVRYLQDAHAAEVGIQNVLDSFVDETDDPTLKALFQDHLITTKNQANRLEARLRELGETPQGAKGLMNSVMARASEILNLGHDEVDRNTQNLMKAYATEHFERAMYEALHAYATAIGDEETARLAKELQVEEEQTAERIYPLIEQFSRMAVTASRSAYPA